MPAKSIGVPFCKRERNPCAWDSAVSQMKAITAHQGVGGSVSERAEVCLLNVLERRHGLRSEHLLSHLICNNVGCASISQDFHYTDADLVPMIIDALQGSDSSSLGYLVHGHCMPQGVNLISEAHQVVALDRGNDHLHHYNMATIPVVIDPVP